MRFSGIRKVHKDCLCTRRLGFTCQGPSWRLTRSGPDCTTCLESLLKEISVIVSRAWHALTLLRSQHLGLGRGGFLGFLVIGSPEHSGRNAISDCGGLGWSRLPRSAQTLFNACATFQELKGIRTRQGGNWFYVDGRIYRPAFAPNSREQTRFNAHQRTMVMRRNIRYLFRRESIGGRTFDSEDLESAL